MCQIWRALLTGPEAHTCRASQSRMRRQMAGLEARRLLLSDSSRASFNSHRPSHTSGSAGRRACSCQPRDDRSTPQLHHESRDPCSRQQTGSRPIEHEERKRKRQWQWWHQLGTAQARRQGQTCASARRMWIPTDGSRSECI
jgi:hypothetical protein